MDVNIQVRDDAGLDQDAGGGGERRWLQDTCWRQSRTGSTRCGESRKEGEGSQVKTETTTRHPPGGPSGQDGSAVRTPLV